MRFFILCFLAMSVSSLMALGNDRVPFADPYILCYGGMYYAYGTHSTNGIAVAVSRNLVDWRMSAGRSKDWLALHKDDSYADRRFWAPEVYRANGKFIMFYSADEHTCAAVAENPLGPFVQPMRRPMIEDFKSIDNSLYIDASGKGWMPFVRFDKGNIIWIAELTDDYLKVKPETMRFCLKATEPWELRMGNIAEGPFIIRHGRYYYLTYSCNDYKSRDYGIGVAVTDDLRKTWVKQPYNPVLQRGFGLPGTGHHSFFKDAGGKVRVVFHAHFSESRIHPRCMYIADVVFKPAEKAGDPPRLTIGGKLIECKIQRGFGK